MFPTATHSLYVGEEEIEGTITLAIWLSKSRGVKFSIKRKPLCSNQKNIS